MRVAMALPWRCRAPPPGPFPGHLQPPPGLPLRPGAPVPTQGLLPVPEPPPPRPLAHPPSAGGPCQNVSAPPCHTHSTQVHARTGAPAHSAHRAEHACAHTYTKCDVHAHAQPREARGGDAAATALESPRASRPPPRRSGRQDVSAGLQLRDPPGLPGPLSPELGFRGLGKGPASPHVLADGGEERRGLCWPRT